MSTTRLLAASLIAPWFALMPNAVIIALQEPNHTPLEPLILMITLGGAICLPIFGIVGVPSYLLLRKLIGPTLLPFSFVALGILFGICFAYFVIPEEMRPFAEMSTTMRVVSFGAIPGFAVTFTFYVIVCLLASRDNKAMEPTSAVER